LTPSQRVVLAHAGSPDTLVAIPWLSERGAEVITVTLDLGQGANLAEIREQALVAGAVRAHVIDARELVAERGALMALRAGAVCLDGDPLVSVLAAPFVAQQLADVASMEQATAVAHGGRSDRMHRLLASLTTLPVLPSMAAAIASAERERLAARLGLPTDDSGAVAPRVTPWGLVVPPGNGDANRWLMRYSARAESPAVVDLSIERGVPRSVNGVSMPFLELIGSLDVIAAGQGVGVVDVSARQERTGPVVAPAAVVLSRAYRALETLKLPAELIELRRELARYYVATMYRGDFFSLTREAIDAFTSKAVSGLTGNVRLALQNGTVEVEAETARAGAMG
jgi:argininosuccinate synthase